MAKEIERKYLLMEDELDYSTPLLNIVFGSMPNLENKIDTYGIDIHQGYLHIASLKDRLMVLRSEDIFHEKLNFDPVIMRLRTYGKARLFTFKGPGKIERDEIEFPLPKRIFDEWWIETEGRRVKKRRYAYDFRPLKLEIDRYYGRNLMIMEIEAASVEAANNLPTFGKDVTEDARYSYRSLVK